MTFKNVVTISDNTVIIVDKPPANFVEIQKYKNHLYYYKKNEKIILNMTFL